jgi:hypothetical protein
MLRRVALVRTDVSEEPSASFIRMKRIGELGKHKLQLATDARHTASQQEQYMRFEVSTMVTMKNGVFWNHVLTWYFFAACVGC